MIGVDPPWERDNDLMPRPKSEGETSHELFFTLNFDDLSKKLENNFF